MFAERQISGLLRQIAGQDVLEIEPQQRAGRVAALAHIAEQYGWEYDGAVRTGEKKQLIVVRMYRDPRPEARAREAATIAAYPQAGNGGAVPGMRSGTLKPLPEAERSVGHLKDRIGFDVMAKAADKRQQLLLWGCVAALVLVLLIAGKPVGALAGGAALAAFLAGALKLGEIRRRRITDRLTAAGFTLVRDDHGRLRFLRPTQQLPGHANPFAA